MTLAVNPVRPRSPRRRVIVDPTPEAPPTKSLAELQAERRAEEKERFLEALETNLGIMSYAAKAAGLCRRTVYTWLDNDPEFLQRVREIDNKQLDFVERKLLENINKNDTRAITFYLSTKGRTRGYTTRVELTTPPDSPLRGEVSVEHREARDEMGDTALSKAMLAAMKSNPAAFTAATRMAAFSGAIDDEDGKPIGKKRAKRGTGKAQ